MEQITRSLFGIPDRLATFLGLVLAEEVLCQQRAIPFLEHGHVFEQVCVSACLDRSSPLHTVVLLFPFSLTALHADLLPLPVKRTGAYENGQDSFGELIAHVVGKLLQEVLRSILEAYYEPQMSEHSHGFRPERGCHTALREIRTGWTGTRWFLEGDITGYFDTINHDVLMEILGEKLQDNRFLRLLSNLLKSGYLEEWKFHKTISGTPQGGVGALRSV